MCPDPPESKHFAVTDRHRRFDSESRYGGHSGHSLRRARPKGDVAHLISGYVDACVRAEHAAESLDTVFMRPIGTNRNAYHRRCGGLAFEVARRLEEVCAEMSTRRDPKCPDVIITDYTVQEHGAEGAGAEAATVYSVSSVRAARNLRRVAIGFDLCHFGCSRCGKNRGCRRFLGSTKVRRHRIRSELAGTVGDAVECHAGEVAGPAEGAAPEPETEDDQPAAAITEETSPSVAVAMAEELAEDGGPAVDKRTPSASPASARGSAADSEGPAGSWFLVEEPVLCLEDGGVDGSEFEWGGT